MSTFLQNELEELYSSTSISREDILQMSLVYVGMGVAIATLATYMHETGAPNPTEKVAETIDSMAEFVGKRCGFSFVNTGVSNPFEAVVRVSNAGIGSETTLIASLMLAGVSMPLKALRIVVTDSEHEHDKFLHDFTGRLLRLVATVGLSMRAGPDESEMLQTLTAMAGKSLDELLGQGVT